MKSRRLRSVLILALPMAAGMTSQNLMNLVDTAMVGVLGPTALAAVGVGSYANFMATAAVMGLASGVQAIAARRIGEGRPRDSAVPLNGGLIMALAVGLPITVLLWFPAPAILARLNPDPAVVTEGIPYLRARLLSVAAVGMNFSFRGHWAGVSLAQYYMRTLVTMHLCNAGLNYLLIFGKLGFPALGTEGAGLASTMSLYLGTGIYVALALRHARSAGFLRGLPDAASFRALLRLSIPTTVQQFLFAAGVTVLFWILGQVGTGAVAVSHVIVTFMLVALLPGIALGLGAMTRVGEALGRKDPDDARRWGWEVTGLACVVLAAIGLPAVLAPGVLLSGFVHEAAIVGLGTGSLRLMGATLAAEGVGMVLMYALLGAGAARAVMVVVVGTQWLIGLPLAWLTAVHLGWGLIAGWACYVGYRALQSAIFMILWARRGWTDIRL